MDGTENINRWLFLDRAAATTASQKVNSFVLPTPPLAPLFETFRLSMLC